MEASLRKARYESKLGMLKAAQDDELGALREDLARLIDERAKQDVKLAEYVHLPHQTAQMREMLAKAEAAATEAIQKREEAEADVLRQLDESQKLLERLLAEQRDKLTGDSKDVRAKLKSETELRHAAEAELSQLKETVERKTKAYEAEASKLKEQIKKLTAPPPKPKPKKPTGTIDLDEGPDAAPVAEQLAQALHKNATRVLDLFRSWDANGDGQVSRAEFHKAMPALGLDVPKQVIDDLFSEWDRDGGGELGYAELRKILQNPKRLGSPSEKTPEQKVATAGAAMKAVSKMRK